jgi:ferredoxin
MIFWFSGTGNSEYAAKRLAKELDEKPIAIAEALHQGTQEFDLSGETSLGFVIPVYANTLPGIVTRFIERTNLSGFSGSYVYGLLTCGVSSGAAGAALALALKEKGVDLSASFDLVMVDNYIFWTPLPSALEIERVLDDADTRLNDIIAGIKRRASNIISRSTPEMRHLPFEKISSAAGTSKFFASKICTACGNCARICPMRCISQSNDGRPVWEGECTICLSCLHRCPNSAIEHGNDALGKHRYINPRLSRVEQEAKQ